MNFKLNSNLIVYKMTEINDLDFETQIIRLTEHFKIRPTYIVLNTLYALLKNKGYKDIPKLQFIESSSNLLDKNSIIKFCEEIKNIIKNEADKEDNKKKNSKEIYMFRESSLLPQNVYVSEKRDDDKLEDNYTEDNITSSSESENSVLSEIEEEQEQGYDIDVYDNDSDEFSE